jgi:hypothetical protein
MQIGYARSSTIDQEAGYKAQLKALKAAGCQRVFAEKVSSVAQRAELEAALDYAREGDALVVIKLDRLYSCLLQAPPSWLRWRRERLCDSSSKSYTFGTDKPEAPPKQKSPGSGETGGSREPGLWFHTGEPVIGRGHPSCPYSIDQRVISTTNGAFPH